MGSEVHAMGEYTCLYTRRAEVLACEDCNVKYEENYEFMELSCGCGCGSSFRICKECSFMFVRCECGCKGNYKIVVKEKPREI